MTRKPYLELHMIMCPRAFMGDCFHIITWRAMPLRGKRRRDDLHGACHDLQPSTVYRTISRFHPNSPYHFEHRHPHFILFHFDL